MPVATFSRIAVVLFLLCIFFAWPRSLTALVTASQSANSQGTNDLPVPPQRPRTVAEIANARLAAAQAAQRAIGEMCFSEQAYAVWSAVRLEAELEVAPTRADRLRALETHLDVTRRVEEITKHLHKERMSTCFDCKVAAYSVLQAELRVVKEKTARQQGATPLANAQNAERELEPGWPGTRVAVRRGSPCRGLD